MQAEEIGLLLKQDRGQFLEFLSAFEYRRRRVAEKTRRGACAGNRASPVRHGQCRRRHVLVGVEPDKSVTGIPHEATNLQTLIQASQNLLRPQLISRLRKDSPRQFATAQVRSRLRHGHSPHRRRPVVLSHRHRNAGPAAPNKSTALKEAKRNVFYERQQALNATWYDLDIDLLTQFVNKLHPAKIRKPS